jgi:hypothetical protein
MDVGLIYKSGGEDAEADQPGRDDAAWRRNVIVRIVRYEFQDPAEGASHPLGLDQAFFR